MRNFRELEVWKAGINLVKDVYLLVESFPESEKFGLTSQMRRCSVSIPSNIAEGCGKESDLDFKRFLQISLGSIYELETQLILAMELKLIDQSKGRTIIQSCQDLQRQVSSFIKHLTR